MIVNEQENISFDSMCDQIFLWFHKILRDWNRALEQKYNSEQLRQNNQESWARY